MNPFSLQNRSTTMTAGLVVLVLFAIWWFFVRSPSVPTGPISVSSASTTPENAQLLSLASQLASISFNTSILSDPRFTSLIDISTQVTPEPEGKNDPFAPIGR